VPSLMEGWGVRVLGYGGIDRASGISSGRVGDVIYLK
jgi:hypothetical protein